MPAILASLRRARTTRAVRRAARAALLSVAVLAAPACGDDDGNRPASIVGTYELRRVNGSDLPETIDNVIFHGGELVISGNGDFALTLDLEFSGSRDDVTFEGTYGRQGSRIIFDGAAGDVDFDVEGTISSNRITIQDPDLTLEFQKT
jgi:hypothetical protein